jgi:hypothetical protein
LCASCIIKAPSSKAKVNTSFVVVVLLAAHKLFIPLFFILFNDTLSTSNISSNSSFGKVSGNALVGSVLEFGQGQSLFRIPQ